MNDEIDPEIEAVLTQRLAEIGGNAGALGGAIGGSIVGAPGTAFAGRRGGERGGGRGAAWAAKRLKTETATDTHTFDPQQAPGVVATLSRALRAQPAGTDSAPDEAVTLRGVVGSGFGGMNPAYVIAVVEMATGHVQIAAYAKEGLIKQRTARKAIDQLLRDLPSS